MGLRPSGRRVTGAVCYKSDAFMDWIRLRAHIIQDGCVMTLIWTKKLDIQGASKQHCDAAHPWLALSVG